MPKSVNKAIELVAKLPPKARRPLVHNLLRTAIRYYAKLEAIGIDNLKKRRGKPTIYIANHLSNMDGPIIDKYLRPYNVTYVAGAKLQDVNITRFIAETISTVTINPGTPDRTAIKNCVDLLRNGGSLVIFPEGTRSRNGQMIESKKGFVLIARLSGASIVPIGLAGTEKLLPINDDNMNQEFLRKADVRITFGEPFILPDKSKIMVKDYNRYAADYCMYRIADLLPTTYRGIYNNEADLKNQLEM